jgi:hypothetical protein
MQVSVVYLIISHRLPRQVHRLAGVLRRGSPNAQVVIHHDREAPPLDRAALRRLDVQLVEPARAVSWGRISHVEAVLRSLSWLAHTQFDWVVLISGQDYPIRPIAEIERRMALADVDAFIEATPCHSPQGRLIDEFALRYHYRWYSMPRWLASKAIRTALASSSFMRIRSIPRSGAWLGVRAVQTPFGDEFECHRGADWFNLSRKAVEILLEQCRSRDELLRYYRRTLIPSESLVQSILANDHGLRLSGDVRRYTQWDRPHGTSPVVLGLDDLDAILGTPADFARKFDEEVDGRVLDEIDRRVHGGGRAVDGGFRVCRL